jgi:hypothetical protein
VLADNKLALNAGWDTEILAIELQALVDLDFDVSLTGFSLAEIDLTIDQAREASITTPDSPADRIPSPPAVAVSKPNDLWLLGRHRLLCGNALLRTHAADLLGQEKADVIFTDPPYNVRIDGNVCGLGSVRHREFAFASGEMTRDQFTDFLTTTLANATSVTKDGAIAFVCMDWRHMGELLQAGERVFSELKNLCVWNKTNGGMGSFYRSKHELVFVFKFGDTRQYQQLRPRRNRAISHQRLGLRRHHWPRRQPHGGAFHASDGQTGRSGGGCDPRLLATRRNRSRRLRRLRNDVDRCRDLRPAGSASRVRPSLLRHDREALGSLHRQARNFGSGRTRI